MNAIYYTLSVAWKEIQVISKERQWLVILFLLPMLIGGFMGGSNLAMARGGNDVVLLDVALVNLDSGTFATETVKAIQAIEQLNVTVYTDAAQAEQQVAEGNLAAAILIPATFTQDINNYVPTRVEVIVDPAEPETASIVTGIMNQVVSEVNIWGEVQYGIRTIFDESGVLAQASPQEIAGIQAQNLGVIMTQINQMRTNPVIAIANEDLQGATVGGGIETFFAYLFPGLTVMFIYFIVTMASTSLLHERESGSMRRLLAATAPRGAIIAGKMLAFMLLACLQVVVLLGVASLLFGTPLGSSPLALVVLTIVVALNATALGMLVAALAKSSGQANSISMVLAFVLAGLGGALAVTPEPFYRSGGFLGLLSKLTPHAHAVEGFYRIMAENQGLIQILPQVGILLAMSVIFFIVALWRFKFE
jgi:ABC-2 type transport system permease protein